MRTLTLAAVAIVLLLATAFAMSPGFRPAVTGSFGPGTTVHSPVVLGSIDFVNPALGFVTIGNTVTNRGYLYKTVNGGTSWRLSLRLPIGGVFPKMGLLGTSLTFLSPRVGFLYTARGSWEALKPWARGVLERTTDGGRSWTRVGLPNEPWQGYVSMSFVSAREGWVLDASGTTMGQSSLAVFHTTTAGRRWKLQAFGGYGTKGRISKGGLLIGSFDEAIHFASRTYGWIFGDQEMEGVAVDNVSRNGGGWWRPCASFPGKTANQSFRYCKGPIPPARLFRQGRKSSSGQGFLTQLDSADFFGKSALLPVMDVIPAGVHPYRIRDASLENLTFGHYDAS